MFKNEIREEIESRSTGLGKIFVDMLFGIWTLIGTAIFMLILNRLTENDNNNKDH